MKRSQHERGVIIPHRELSPVALRGLIEEFVTRHGTDGGYTQKTLDQNVTMVLRQLDSGDAVIVYDNVSQTANITVNKE